MYAHGVLEKGIEPHHTMVLYRSKSMWYSMVALCMMKHLIHVKSSFNVVHRILEPFGFPSLQKQPSIVFFFIYPFHGVGGGEIMYPLFGNG